MVNIPTSYGDDWGMVYYFYDWGMSTINLGKSGDYGIVIYIYTYTITLEPLINGHDEMEVIGGTYHICWA